MADVTNQQALRFLDLFEKQLSSLTHVKQVIIAYDAALKDMDRLAKAKSDMEETIVSLESAVQSAQSQLLAARQQVKKAQAEADEEKKAIRAAIDDVKRELDKERGNFQAFQHTRQTDEQNLAAEISKLEARRDNLKSQIKDLFNKFDE